MATTTPKIRLRWYHKILVPLISVGVFLGLSELACWGLRLAPPKRPAFKFVVRDFENDVEYPFMVEDAILLWAPKPGFQGEKCYCGMDVQINSAGLRDREYPLAKTPGVFRILCLGDSTTFGYGLSIDDTYHSLLEEILNLVGRPSGRRYKVINGGVSGYSSAQCHVMYEHRGRKFRPDMVLLNVGPNDARGRSHMSDGQLLSRQRSHVARRIDDSLSNLHSYRTLRRLLPDPVKYGTEDETKTVPRVDLETYQRNIAELDESCRADGCRLVLISFAYCSQIAHDHFERLQLDENDFANREACLLSYRQALETAARERKIPLLSVPLLTMTPNRELFVDSLHPNQGGHLLLALTLEQFFRDYGLLTKAGQPPSAAPDLSQRNDIIREFLDEYVRDRGYLPEASSTPSTASDGSMRAGNEEE